MKPFCRITLVVLSGLVCASAHALAFTPKDARELIPDYARSHNIDLRLLTKLLSPSGRIDFDEQHATGSLVIGANIVVTSLHTYCVSVAKGLKNLENVKFTFFNGTADETIGVAKIFKEGESCAEFRKKDVQSTIRDWIVLILKKPAVGPVPYAINPAEVRARLPNKLHLYSNHARNFCARDSHGHCIPDKRFSQSKTSKTWVMPPTLQDCVAQSYAMSEDYSYLTQIQTACASGHGASGGPFLSENLMKPTIYAILAGDSLNKADAKKEDIDGAPIVKPYKSSESASSDDWESFAVVVDGPFAAAIRDAAAAN